MNRYLCALFIFKISSRHKCFNYLKRLLPRDRVKQLDWLLTLRCRRRKWLETSKFIKECLTRGIYTSKLRTRIRNNRMQATVEVCNDFLTTELTNAQAMIDKIDAEIENVKPVLKLLDFVGFCKFTKLQNFHIEEMVKKMTQKHRKVKESCMPVYPPDMDRRILNLSSYNLSLVERQALCLELGFAIPPKRKDQLLINAEFENFYQQLSDVTPKDADQLPAFRADLVSLSHSYGRERIEHSSFLPSHREALLKLKRNPNLLILRPDKGSGVIIMDRDQYVSKMETILSDDTKFKKDQRQFDETNKKDKAIISSLKKLRNEGVLSPSEYKRLYPRGSTIPRLYGIPKTHKRDIPMRPILSMTNTSYELLSKWLAEKLQAIQEYFSELCVQDSFSFVEMLRGDHSSLSISSSSMMVSYDVSSLFTNVPVRETIDIITQTVEEQPHLCPISPAVLKEALMICTTNVQFSFDNTLWRQVDGVAMGSPLGCLFANVFMGHLEKKIRGPIQSHCLLYRRYVDDSFVLIKDKKSALDLLHILNNAHPSLTFTCEFETNNFLPFLDVGVHKHSDGYFSTSVFRKPTFCGVYLNFNSFAPVNYKKGLVRSLYIRACRICSDEHLQPEFDFLKYSLLMNGYPEYFINRHMVDSVAPNVPTQSAEKKSVFLQLPFYGDGPASRLRKALSTLTSRIFSAAKPVIIFDTNKLPVRSPKDSLPASSMSSVIYSFHCGCRSASYIGRTSRSLEARTREHIPRWLEMGHQGRSVSSISDHLLTCDNCPPAPREIFKVIARGRHSLHLRILEALFIKRHRPNLCKQKDYVIDLHLPW